MSSSQQYVSLFEGASEVPEYWCCICKTKQRNYGNNASPYKKGKCCDECNRTHVIPCRIEGMLLERNFWEKLEKFFSKTQIEVMKKQGMDKVQKLLNLE